jgi:ubiquitin-like domain-containing CTD phosphatase 1
MSEDTPSSTVEAVPDVQHGITPGDSKKPKLFHALPLGAATDGDSSSSSFSSASDPSPATPSSSPARELENGEISPVVMAVQLPADDEIKEKEEWWDLRMSWSGKVYEMRVGGNDMSATCFACVWS